jgi:hypothetical protein
MKELVAHLPKSSMLLYISNINTTSIAMIGIWFETSPAGANWL